MEIVNLPTCTHEPKDYKLFTNWLDKKFTIKLCYVCWAKIVGQKSKNISVEGKLK